MTPLSGGFFVVGAANENAQEIRTALQALRALPAAVHLAQKMGARLGAG
jgi:hypothetical protein